MFQTLRSLLYLLGMAVLTFFFGILSLLTVFVPYKARYYIITRWSKTNLIWLQLTCGLGYEVIGKENLPDYPCIVMSNHQSAWETMAIGVIFPPLIWVIKRELLFIPVFGWGMALTHPIALNRKAGRNAVDQLVEKGKDRLSKGYSILIFPEGTRTPPGDRRKFKIGGALLAEQSGVPIIPVVHNSGKFWARRQLVKKPGIVTLIIGEPIQTKNKKASAINEEVYVWISVKRDELER